jgi:hypothetical protein
MVNEISSGLNRASVTAAHIGDGPGFKPGIKSSRHGDACPLPSDPYRDLVNPPVTKHYASGECTAVPGLHKSGGTSRRSTAARRAFQAQRPCPSTGGSTGGVPDTLGYVGRASQWMHEPCMIPQ